MCQSSRVKTYRFDSKTKGQMFPLLDGRHVGGHQHGVSIQSSINLGEKLFRVTREWITAQILIMGRLFI